MIGELTNHVWQSTLFALAAALLTIAFRKNRAQIRYWLWLGASLKFLIPFVFLMNLGSRLRWTPTTERLTSQPVSFTMVQITQPFPHTASFLYSAPQATNWPMLTILIVWACGFGVISLIRFRAWLRIRAAVRSSKPARISAAVEVRTSPGLLEPGVVGLLRPVLLLPEGILERLTPPQLEAVLAHEVCHVRRRDNITAVIHMIVEAVFWFHPLVWWIGAELVKERERACDEAVLRSGSVAQVYAEGILSVCKFYVESPLACVPGVTGPNLRKRVDLIMKNHVGKPLSLGRKFLLATASTVALALPITLGLLNAAPSRAESQAESTMQSTAGYQTVSIRVNKTGEAMAPFVIIGKPALGVSWRPGQFLATNITLRQLIVRAYGVQDEQVTAGPDWLDSQRYDIQASAGQSEIDEIDKLSQDKALAKQKSMLQALLAERFQLALHRATADLPVYALVIAAGGPKLQVSKAEGTPGLSEAPDQLLGQGVPVSQLVGALAKISGGHVVVDNTGLTGAYDFKLRWKPGTEALDAPSSESSPSLLSALREQLGLELKPETAPVETLVIDHAEPPSATDVSESQAHDPVANNPSLEVASIKRAGPDVSSNGMVSLGLGGILTLPDVFTTTNSTLEEVLRAAYGVKDFQISGAPNWLNSERYDIDARVSRPVADELGKLSPEQRTRSLQRLLQALLVDRLKLAVHMENQEALQYSLVVAPDGPRLQESAPEGRSAPNGQPIVGVRTMVTKKRDQLTCRQAPISVLAGQLAEQLHATVLDRTGLMGNYDFTLHWRPGDEPPKPSSSDSSMPSLFAALQEQLGLQVESHTGVVETLVIDHVERPSGN